MGDVPKGHSLSPQGLEYFQRMQEDGSWRQLANVAPSGRTARDDSMPDPTPAPDEMVVVRLPLDALTQYEALRHDPVARDTAAGELADAVLDAEHVDLETVRREERAKAIEEAARVCDQQASELRAMAEDAGWRGEMDAFEFTARADVASRCARGIHSLATPAGKGGGGG